MFRRISILIALQFTGFVFLLTVATGGIFLTAHVASRRHESSIRLAKMLQLVMDNPLGLERFPSAFPAFQRDRVRIVNADGVPMYSGVLYGDTPFVKRPGISHMFIEDEMYDVLTAPLVRNDQQIGFIQVADRAPPNDLSEQIFLYLLVSGSISALTFGVGLYFARRSLKPAEEMVVRLEQFTQDASHELRTPLTAVNTSIDLAILGDAPMAHLKDAKHDLRQVFVLIERLLELARLDAFVLQSEPINLSELVEESVKKHAQFAKDAKVAIETNITPQVTAQGDAALFKQVLSNLLMNAIKFNKEDGHIDVTLEKSALTVKDAGSGISQAALPHIFDRFFQEEASRSGNKGLGLGLALVKKIVELHGWTITAESKEGKGTKFTIKFS